MTKITNITILLDQKYTIYWNNSTFGFEIFLLNKNLYFLVGVFIIEKTIIGCLVKAYFTLKVKK